ncbi:MAG TPA: hypothetical protein PKW90_12390, partial [Myxococcota bacterium]|nr:hypothetical protein [Myxococcota bacterium]
MRLLTLLSFAACTADPHKADPTNDTAPPDDSTPPSHPDFPGTGTHRYDAARSGVQQGDPATWSGDWQSRWSQTVGRTSAVITAGDRLFSVEESFLRARSTADGSLIWEQSLPDTGAGL